jgi:hypothetical protein
MVQSTVWDLQQALLDFLDWLLPGFMVVLVVATGLMIAGLMLYALDRDGFIRTRDWALARAVSAAVWLPVVLTLALVVLALPLVLERFVNQSSARYSNLEDPAGGQTVQNSPTGSFQQETGYDRSIIIPGFLAARLNTLEAAQLLAPYLVDPSGENIKKTRRSVQSLWT